MVQENLLILQRFVSVFYLRMFINDVTSVSETVLIAWICGEEAKFMERLKMNVVADTCTMILKKFLADPLIPKPKSCLL